MIVRKRIISAITKKLHCIQKCGRNGKIVIMNFVCHWKSIPSKTKKMTFYYSDYNINAPTIVWNLQENNQTRSLKWKDSGTLQTRHPLWSTSQAFSHTPVSYPPHGDAGGSVGWAIRIIISTHTIETNNLLNNVMVVFHCLLPWRNHWAAASYE